MLCVGIMPCGTHILVDWQIQSPHIASMGEPTQKGLGDFESSYKCFN